MGRTLIVTAVVVAALVFGLKGTDKPSANPSSGLAETSSRSETTPVLPPLKHFSTHDGGLSRWPVLTDY